MTNEESGLRARLVETGVELLAREGVEALDLCEIARRAGVPQGAPRRYVPTHRELLSAIARHGFADLATRVQATLAGAPETDPRGRLATLGRVYLEYARTDPGMFELMFRHDLLESDAPGLRETSLPLFGVLVDLVGRTRPAGADPAVAAAAFWANLHGIAQLWHWGSLQPAAGRSDVEPLLQAVLDAHLGTADR
ncbi:TetR/AcrR family transcriptional regulator [Kitasatospora camelliae]|uniref:TetR/AcrR family transcriptional regulator n=1 Tax=Kitasatospora camelliae TaxID=3156397 RepID=A0AAU8JQA0_9ACTN